MNVTYAVIDKVLEQYKRGLLTTDETRFEIIEIIVKEMHRV